MLGGIVLTSFINLLLSIYSSNCLADVSERISKVEAINDTEMALRYLERIRSQEILKTLKYEGINIRGFYHTSTWRPDGWAKVVDEQLRLMDGSRLKNFLVQDKWSPRIWVSLLDIVDQLNMVVAGVPADYDKMSTLLKTLKLKHIDKINLQFRPTMERDKYRYAKPEEQELLRIESINKNLTEGEYSSVNELHQYCKNEVKNGRKSYVFYAHNKGACCMKGQSHPIAEWREEMNTFILEFPSIFMRALYNGYVGCGVEYESAHYSGNYWWARCDHVAALKGLWDPINNAYASELLLYNVSKDYGIRSRFAEECAYNIFHCRVNHYVGRCPREVYLPVIMGLLATPQLPPNPTSKIKLGTVTNKPPSYCTKAYRTTYIDQPTWDRGGVYFPT